MFFEKSSRNIWWFKINHLSLHRFSALKKSGRLKVLRKSFLKKVIKKFGGLKIITYLCTAFPL
jgi:hypothetical protein